MFVFGNVNIRCSCVFWGVMEGGTETRQKEESAMHTKEKSGLYISQNVQMSFQE